MSETRQEELKRVCALERHPEGGWFAKNYAAPFESGGRPLAGSIYFLLDGEEISHFHEIDCDEIWYYHEGCGMRVTMLWEGRTERLLLGPDLAAGQRQAVVLPAGSVFAAENLDKAGYTFISCATTPEFRYEGFRLVRREEIRAMRPGEEELLPLAYPDA